jgi:hypothetical protein
MAGKRLGALRVSLASVRLVLLVLIVVGGVWSAPWGEVGSYPVLALLIFIAVGTLLGTLLWASQPVMALSIGVALPLFFPRGGFGPISFTTEAVQASARLFPVYYAIVLRHRLELQRERRSGRRQRLRQRTGTGAHCAGAGVPLPAGARERHPGAGGADGRTRPHLRRADVQFRQRRGAGHPDADEYPNADGHAHADEYRDPPPDPPARPDSYATSDPRWHGAGHAAGDAHQLAGGDGHWRQHAECDRQCDPHGAAAGPARGGVQRWIRDRGPDRLDQ